MTKHAFFLLVPPPWLGTFAALGMGMGGSQQGPIFVPQPNRIGYNRMLLFICIIQLIIIVIYIHLYTFKYIFIYLYIYIYIYTFLYLYIFLYIYIYISVWIYCRYLLIFDHFLLIYGKTFVRPPISTLSRPYTETSYVYKPNLNFFEMAHTNLFSSIRKAAYPPFDLH